MAKWNLPADQAAAAAPVPGPKPTSDDAKRQTPAEQLPRTATSA